MHAKVYVGDVAFGIAASLLTGIINVTPTQLVGAAWYGWPIPWLYSLVTYPPATTYNYTSLAIDAVFWFAVAFVVSLVLTHDWRRRR